MIALLRDSDVKVRTNATVTLWNLSKNAINRDAIREAQGIAPLIALLQDPNNRRNAAAALENLAINETNRDAIREAQGIAPLIMLLQDPNNRRLAAAALQSLSINEINRNVIREVHGIAPLVVLLQDSFNAMRQHAAAILWNLALNATNKDAIRAAQGIAPLVALLKDLDEVARQYAAGALRNLAYNDLINQATMIDCGAVPLLSALASTDENARSALAACQSLIESRKSTTNTSSTYSKMSVASDGSEVEVLRRQLAEQERQLEKAQADARTASLAALMNKASLKGSSDSAAPAVPIIPQLALKIDRNKRLGEGGFGVVYKGTWQMVTVAVKQLHATKLSAEALASFQEEAERHGLLRHPNVVMLYGICIDPERYSMVMEFMAGGSLYHLLHGSQNMLWSVKLSIASNIATGLYYLHEQHIIHRDLKSMNVLMDEHGQAKLADFGLATIKSETSSTVTTSTSTAGTTRWMAPELFKRGGKCDTSTDIYALGWVLWELSSHKLPFQDEKHATDAIIMQWIKDGEREDIPATTPPKYAQLLAQCWHQRSEARPNNVQEVVERLKGIATEDVSLPSGYQYFTS